MISHPRRRAPRWSEDGVDGGRLDGGAWGAQGRGTRVTRTTGGRTAGGVGWEGGEGLLVGRGGKVYGFMGV